MDMLQRLGGRKWILALVAIGVGAYIELYTQRGLSQTMAGLLAALVASFHAANHFTTQMYLKSKGSSGASASDSRIEAMSAKLDKVHDVAVNAQDGEQVKQFVTLLKGIQDSLVQVQSTTGQVGQAVLNVSRDVQMVKKATTQPINF